MRRIALLGLMAVSLAGNSRWDEEGREWWKNVEYLASDDLEGRNVGTRGFDLAANYVAEQYERTGLKAAGDDGYFQKVFFTETTLTFASVRLLRQGRVDPVPVPGEALIRFTPESSTEIQAPIVFAGYGLRIPEAGHDDLSGLPVKGAVVAYLAGTPSCLPGNLRAHYNSADVRWQTLHAAGAVGMIAIQNPNNMEIPWTQQAAGVSTPTLTLTDPHMNRYEGMQFGAVWNPAQADDLLAGSGYTFSEILAAESKQEELPRFKIGSVVKAITQVDTRIVRSKNVVALHPGTDESLRDEYVVISAHLDHLGTSKPARNQRIFPGAMDDASGVSSLIEIAKRLKTIETKRSVMFLAVTGEEKGELGSAYFARYPSVSGKIVADLNLDMFLPLFPLKWLEVQGLEESTLGDDIRAVAEQAGVQVQTDKEPNQNRFVRSDQYSFVKAGIPALAFKFGYQKGAPEERIFQQWIANRYHGVKDDSEQPVDFEAAAKFNDIMRLLALRVADADEAPKWNDSSFFRRFASTPGI